MKSKPNTLIINNNDYPSILELKKEEYIKQTEQINEEKRKATSSMLDRYSKKVITVL